MDSILGYVKKMLGICEEDSSFDGILIGHINAAIILLNSFLEKDEDIVLVKSEQDTWDMLFDSSLYEIAKEYIYLKVKLLFDPPTSSIHMDSIKSTISELEWRINNIRE